VKKLMILFVVIKLLCGQFLEFPKGVTYTEYPGLRFVVKDRRRNVIFHKTVIDIDAISTNGGKTWIAKPDGTPIF
jgi:hypothetical protein